MAESGYTGDDLVRAMFTVVERLAARAPKDEGIQRASERMTDAYRAYIRSPHPAESRPSGHTDDVAGLIARLRGEADAAASIVPSEAPTFAPVAMQLKAVGMLCGEAASALERLAASVESQQSMLHTALLSVQAAESVTTALAAERDEARRLAESTRDDEESAARALADVTRLPVPKRIVFPWEQDGGGNG